MQHKMCDNIQVKKGNAYEGELGGNRFFFVIAVANVIVGQSLGLLVVVFKCSMPPCTNDKPRCTLALRRETGVRLTSLAASCPPVLRGERERCLLLTALVAACRTRVATSSIFVDTLCPRTALWHMACKNPGPAPS